MAYDFSENIQRSIIYLYKMDHQFHLTITNLIKKGYFEYPVHANLFEAIERYYGKYRKLPTDDFIIEEVKRQGPKKIEDYIDELEFINEVKFDPSGNVDYYVKLIEDFARKEAMKGAIKKCVILIQKGRVEETENVIKEALLVGRDINIGQDYFNAVRERWLRESSKKYEEKFPTVFQTCNKHLGGGHSRKELCVVIASSGLGKSLFLVNQAVRFLQDNKKVLYLSLEMSEDKIAHRFDSVISLIPHTLLKETSGQLSLHKRLQVFNEVYPEAKLVIKELPIGQANVNNIRQLLMQLRLHENFAPDAICVDYLELLLPIRRTEQEYMAQQRVAEELRGLAVETNTLLWTATQVNRCFSPSTKLYIYRNNERILSQIQNVREGDLVETVEGLRKVMKTYSRKAQKVYKITLKSGKNIMCSSNHKFPLKTGHLCSLEDGLTVGDFLLVKK